MNDICNLSNDHVKFNHANDKNNDWGKITRHLLNVKFLVES